MVEYLTKDAILGADDLPSEDVEVKEWGGTVRVRGLTATERDRFEFSLAASKDKPDQTEVRAQVVGRCLVDGDGKRLFTDKELSKLGAKNAAPVDRLFDKVRELSGMSDRAVEDAAEDFNVAPDDGSPSG